MYIDEYVRENVGVFMYHKLYYCTAGAIAKGLSAPSHNMIRVSELRPGIHRE